MFKKLSLNIRSSLVYFKSFILFFIIFTLLLIYFIPSNSVIISLVLIYAVLNVLLMNAIGKRRREDMSAIAGVIKKLRTEEIKDEEGILLNGSFQEIETELRELFKHNKGIIEYLRKLEKMRTQFIANTSHELRTPLFAIQGFIETLLSGALEDPEVNRLFLEKASRHTHNLNNLINDLIDISMIESGEMRMHFRYFEINEYLRGITEEFRDQAEKENLSLNLIPTGKKLSLFGDKEKIRQVMTNLIQNAIRYTDKGGIDIIVEEEPKFGKITVKDTGIGIPPEEINRIFERFYRVDRARSREEGGTGLGLAIVKHIIEAHNSKIEVKSELNRGSEFSFRLKK